MNIGLTGGIASGKSTVSSLLCKYGSVLIDADRIAREIVEPGSPLLQQIAHTFGQAILLEDGRLDRKRLGSIIFADKEKRLQLNALMHPPIRAEIRRQMNKFEHDDPNRLVVADIPLLYESNLQHMFSEVMVVYIPLQIQIRRLMEREGIDSAQAEERIRSQMSLEKKKELADVVIDNSDDLAGTEDQIVEFLRRKGIV